MEGFVALALSLVRLNLLDLQIHVTSMELWIEITVVLELGMHELDTHQVGSLECPSRSHNARKLGGDQLGEGQVHDGLCVVAWHVEALVPYDTVEIARITQTELQAAVVAVALNRDFEALATRDVEVEGWSGTDADESTVVGGGDGAGPSAVVERGGRGSAHDDIVEWCERECLLSRIVPQCRTRTDGSRDGALRKDADELGRLLHESEEIPRFSVSFACRQ